MDSIFDYKISVQKNLILFVLCLSYSSFSFSQIEWKERAYFPGGGRSFATSFVIDGIAYICGGDGIESDIFWKYDPIYDRWDQVGKIPFNPYYTNSFVVNSKAYVINLHTEGGTNIWEYDPANNTWILKSEFPGERRSSAIAFSYENYGYYGLGSRNGKRKDLWRYDPKEDIWQRTQDFPVERSSPVVFKINNVPYVGLGDGYSPIGKEGLIDVYKFGAGESWLKIANFPGLPRQMAVGFSIGHKGYITTGLDLIDYNYLNDFWEYDSFTDTWKQLDDFPAEKRQAAVSFNIENRGFICTGYQSGILSINLYNDLWEYSSFNDIITDLSYSQKNRIEIFPNPFIRLVNIKNWKGTLEQLKVWTSDGKLIINEPNINKNSTQLDLSSYKSSIFLLEIDTETNKYRKILMRGQ